MNPMQAMGGPRPMGPMGGQPPGGGQPPMGGPPPMGPMGGPQAGFSVPAEGVNLFKVQEDLKDMTPQMVMAYANGQNPDMVPPYVALGEMERRTRAAKKAQPAQAPTGTVKDALAQGLASLGGMPPQTQPAPPRPRQDTLYAARGGLAAVPVPARMTTYRDGGIIGYQSRGSVDVDEAEDYADEADNAESAGVSEEDAARPIMLAQAGSTGANMGDPRAMYGASTETLNRLLQQRTQAPKSRAEVMAELAKTDPEKFAMLNRDVEGEHLKRLAELQAKQGEGDAQSREDLQSKRRMDLFQSLIAAGEATRGQKGLGGLFGGMGASLGRSSAERMEEEAALRALPLKRQEIMAKAQYEMQGLQRARAEGDIKAEAMHQQNLAKLNNELQKAQLAAAGRQVGATGNILGRQVSGEAAKESAGIQAKQRLESSKLLAEQRKQSGLARIAADKEIAGMRANAPKATGAAKAPPIPADMKSLQDEIKANVTARAKAAANSYTRPEVIAEMDKKIAELKRRLETYATTGTRSPDTMAPAPAAGPAFKVLGSRPSP